jgi:hypothetical protein
LHIAKNVVLQLGHRLQRIPHSLVLLNVTDHLCRLRTLGEVDEGCLLDDGGDAILDKG